MRVVRTNDEPGVVAGSASLGPAPLAPVPLAPTPGSPASRPLVPLRLDPQLAAEHLNASHKNPALTGIRGIAAVWVVVFHFYPTVASLLALPQRSQLPGIRDGFLAVDLFFLLSGFVLSLSYAERFQRRFADSLRGFAWARARRILPLHWAMLGILVVLVTCFPSHWWGPGPFTPGSLVADAVLVQDWASATALSWNHPTWSLSAEWFAYMLFPLLAYGMARLPGVRTTTAAAIASLAALDALILARHSLTLDHVGEIGIVRCVCEFTAGALLWKLLSFGRFGGNAWGWGNAWACIGSALLAVAVAVPRVQLAAPFAFASLILAGALRSRLGQWLFGNPVVVFLGEVSFSIYLTHVILLGTMTLIGGRLDVADASLALRIGFVLLLGAAVVPVSYATWRFIERPGQRLALSRSVIRQSNRCGESRSAARDRPGHVRLASRAD
jgi:peptidoglycan/LPS O-acetylase OafA/YrhL